ncbi:TIR domain-containing protein [Tengunoibacter tsumagoiensis]|uniref:TIR domain-containing protein n=1 Tax=Tengunoibacter tsumagoiensis TaxID=2014871 RepID=A0A402A7Y1_9CHLR|nr:TIR domain-containing protein [Tengunoibacter tsumagoiensis]GCE15264.1 hypothetical protein KTT_51230 [Tengunoibacter tsumagoiensis]
MSSHMTLFCCYAQKERGLAQRLEQQLAPLLRRGAVGAWNELAIDVVGGWDDVHRHHYTTADIILWLVSPDFLASDYLQSAEMVNALEWQRRNEVRLVPILAEPAPWNDGRFSQLDLLPKNGLALTDSAWPDQEEACYAVVEALHTLIKELDTSPLQAKVQPAAPPPLGAPSRVSVLTGTLPLWRRRAFQF